MKSDRMKLMSRQTLEKIIICFLFFLASLALIHDNLFLHIIETQFTALAQSFLHGHLYLSADDGNWLDGSYYKGYVYWPQGVFPAIVLLPFVAVFGDFMQQGYLQFGLNILNAFLLYAIALKITRNKMTSLWLSFAYMFSTAYIVVGLIPWAGWLAQVIATTSLLFALYEFLHKRRWFLIGVYMACGFLTRIDLFLGGLFFVLFLLQSKEGRKRRLQQFLLFCIPLFIGIVGLFLYNFFRFGSPFEFGYKYHIPELVAARAMFKQYGTWNLEYYPTNMYYLFLKGFDHVVVQGTGYLAYPYIAADIWGLSIFITSPIFLWCLQGIKKTIRIQEVQGALLSSLLILLFILGYFGVGTRQYGYRYALDFTPFLYLVLCYSFRDGMSRTAKIVIIISFAFNYFLFPTIF